MAVISRATPRHALPTPAPLARLAAWATGPHPALREFVVDWAARAALAALPASIIVVGVLMKEA